VPKHFFAYLGSLPACRADSFVAAEQQGLVLQDLPDPAAALPEALQGDFASLDRLAGVLRSRASTSARNSSASSTTCCGSSRIRLIEPPGKNGSRAEFIGNGTRASTVTARLAEHFLRNAVLRYQAARDLVERRGPRAPFIQPFCASRRRVSCGSKASFRSRVHRSSADLGIQVRFCSLRQINTLWASSNWNFVRDLP